MITEKNCGLTINTLKEGTRQVVKSAVLADF